MVERPGDFETRPDRQAAAMAEVFLQYVGEPANAKKVGGRDLAGLLVFLDLVANNGAVLQHSNPAILADESRFKQDFVASPADRNLRNAIVALLGAMRAAPNRLVSRLDSLVGPEAVLTTFADGRESPPGDNDAWIPADDAIPLGWALAFIHSFLNSDDPPAQLIYETFPSLTANELLLQLRGLVLANVSNGKSFRLVLSPPLLPDMAPAREA